MAKAGNVKDRFPQFMKLKVTQSSANTLTFSQISLGGPVFQYAGIIINRIEYSITAATLELMTVTEDFCQLAITGSDSIATLGTDQPEVYDEFYITKLDQGAIANNSPKLIVRNWVKDYSTFPEGGCLVPLQDIYLAMASGGLASPGVAGARLWYQIIELTAQDYIEIAQRLRVLST